MRVVLPGCVHCTAVRVHMLIRLSVHAAVIAGHNPCCHAVQLKNTQCRAPTGEPHRLHLASRSVSAEIAAPWCSFAATVWAMGNVGAAMSTPAPCTQGSIHTLSGVSSRCFCQHSCVRACGACACQSASCRVDAGSSNERSRNERRLWPGHYPVRVSGKPAGPAVRLLSAAESL